ncbi:putative tRNA methyltransferase 10 A [Paratrimastix pyriformis]|uniref:tRNA (guanine(9)-N(1))-methyltransferase n=1 Tax=Paratrimastix pyriformis TaxID=342808 RepID=A0ABQ8UDA8_9EUKA|nr:putative tRNA methyltransferase 10 A [Paratrimastix pyriformis]
MEKESVPASISTPDKDVPAEIPDAPASVNPPVDSAQPAQDAPKLSKRERKRQALREVWKDRKKEEKQKKKARLEQKRKQWAEEEARMTPEEREAQIAKRRERAERRRLNAGPDPNAVRIVIDCSYDPEQTEKEARSLGQQVMYAYAVNKNAEKPVRMYVTSYGGHSPHVIHELDPTKVYIIGGMVDHNRMKVGMSVCITLGVSMTGGMVDHNRMKVGMSVSPWVGIIGGMVDHEVCLSGRTFRDATALGIETAALPLREFMEFTSRDVLAVNHVFEILQTYNDTHQWPAALQRAMPNRKNAVLKTASGVAPALRHPRTRAVPAPLESPRPCAIPALERSRPCAIPVLERSRPCPRAVPALRQPCPRAVPPCAIPPRAVPALRHPCPRVAPALRHAVALRTPYSSGPCAPLPDDPYGGNPYPYRRYGRKPVGYTRFTTGGT